MFVATFPALWGCRLETSYSSVCTSPSPLNRTRHSSDDLTNNESASRASQRRLPFWGWSRTAHRRASTPPHRTTQEEKEEDDEDVDRDSNLQRVRHADSRARSPNRASS
eukprot:CAMPEP_0197441686 /NCGR_PEP_ID=MMETSP1175-20131217/7907_1 /TAXON_ID=1003142 /ORGANISM="Triceratium dubium, Strain CCMP147" /LENGTH=108 /DNA_ID=CAMNT_0042972009 /DNA_START=53 /DNA_END=379 /DNA_ORIENTATION=+